VNTEGLAHDDADAGVASDPRIFLYDNYPGGIGFSEPLFTMHDRLVADTRALIAGCACEIGCPSCVGPLGDVGPRAREMALALADLLDAADRR
jgi:DEAD/DEAH box helicase domain-containing protein